MAKKLTENHPLQKKVRELEKYMSENGLYFNIIYNRIEISDGETTATYKEADSGEYENTFPSTFESKLVMED